MPTDSNSVLFCLSQWPYFDYTKLIPTFSYLFKATLSLKFQHLTSFFVDTLNPLNPKSDQHQISPCNINTYKTEWSRELINRMTQDELA